MGYYQAKNHKYSPYLRKHEPGWLLVMPAVCKTQLCAFASVLPHFTVHVPCVRLIGCHFWDGALVFQRSEHFTTSKPPTNILWFSTFYIPNFFCGVTHVLSNFESHNRTSALLPSMTRVLWGILSHVTPHRHCLQSSFVNTWSSSRLWHEPKACNRSDLEESDGFLPGAFSLENDTNSASGWSHHIWIYSQIPKTHFTRESHGKSGVPAWRVFF